ncbi:hypothetical protein LCGC14_2310640 [marine sediment metagenome]|uniref:Uncharacterized protein n=1 Tax=marine sediment metagenome TaxID=412755 RepID=A0A0F9EY40_9ZZZZ
MGTILDEMANQSSNINVNDWHCLTCRNYKGQLRCGANVFIAFEGANLAMCSFYERGRKCSHCGRVA